MKEKTIIKDLEYENFSKKEMIEWSNYQINKFNKFYQRCQRTSIKKAKLSSIEIMWNNSNKLLSRFLEYYSQKKLPYDLSLQYINIINHEPFFNYIFNTASIIPFCYQGNLLYYYKKNLSIHRNT